MVALATTHTTRGGFHPSMPVPEVLAETTVASCILRATAVCSSYFALEHIVFQPFWRQRCSLPHWEERRG